MILATKKPATSPRPDDSLVLYDYREQVAMGRHVCYTSEHQTLLGTASISREFSLGVTSRSWPHLGVIRWSFLRLEDFLSFQEVSLRDGAYCTLNLNVDGKQVTLPEDDPRVLEIPVEIPVEIPAPTSPKPSLLGVFRHDSAELVFPGQLLVKLHRAGNGEIQLHLEVTDDEELTALTALLDPDHLGLSCPVDLVISTPAGLFLLGEVGKAHFTLDSLTSSSMPGDPMYGAVYAVSAECEDTKMLPVPRKMT